MHAIEELKDYVGFTAADAERLRALWPALAPEAEELAARFYATAGRYAGSRAVLRGEEHVAQLRRTMVTWLEELCRGPHDQAYFERRRAIGRSHVRVGLPQAYMFTGMSLLREGLIRTAARAAEDFAGTTLAITRITDIELAIMVGAYMEVHEERNLADLREVIVSHIPTTVLLLDRSLAVLSLADPSGRILRAGARLDEVLPPVLDDAAQLTARVAHASASGREVVLPRVEAELAGENRCFRITVVPLDHPMAGTLIHIEDHTEIIASEARARHSEHLAEIGMVATTIAHELRNPLAGIRAAVQLVEHSFADGDPRAAVLRQVQDQTDRLGTLAADLLSYAKPPVVENRALDLAVVLDAVALGEPAISRCDGEGTAVGNAALLTQVVLNLVQNALQAGAREIHVLADGPEVRVLDDGPGIEPGLRERIFEPFFTTKTRGTGLGLPIARRLVAAMNGSLALCDSPLGGAGFVVSLPAAG